MKQDHPKPLSGMTLRVSESALRRNIRSLRARLPTQARFGAVVKSDGYGHGMTTVSRVATDEGARFLVVSALAEALEIRRLGLATDILIVGPILPEEAHETVGAGFAAAVGSIELARALDAAAQLCDTRARVHLKIDTGMGRYGFLHSPESIAPAVSHLAALQNIEIEGVLTHFTESDVPGSEFTNTQARRFRLALREIEAAGYRPRWIHASNSGGVLHAPELSFSMARLGIAMYGAYPGPVIEQDLYLEPVMTATTRVADVREVPADFPISYGRTFVTQRPTRLALLPTGYGDGYPRHASGRAEVLIRGRRAPVLGRVTMNLIVVDVTDLEGVQVGDRVLLFGRLGEDVLRVEELADAADTISYEILCNVGRGAPRWVVED